MKTIIKLILACLFLSSVFYLHGFKTSSDESRKEILMQIKCEAERLECVKKDCGDFNNLQSCKNN